MRQRNEMLPEMKWTNTEYEIIENKWHAHRPTQMHLEHIFDSIFFRCLTVRNIQARASDLYNNGAQRSVSGIHCLCCPLFLLLYHILFRVIFSFFFQIVFASFALKNIAQIHKNIFNHFSSLLHAPQHFSEQIYNRYETFSWKTNVHWIWIENKQGEKVGKHSSFNLSHTAKWDSDWFMRNMNVN